MIATPASCYENCLILCKSILIYTKWYDSCSVNGTTLDNGDLYIYLYIGKFVGTKRETERKIKVFSPLYL